MIRKNLNLNNSKLNKNLHNKKGVKIQNGYFKTPR